MSLRARALAYLALAATVSCALTIGLGIVLVRHHVAAQQLDQLRATADTLLYTSGHPVARRAGVHVYRVDVHRHHAAGPRFTAAVARALPASGDTQGTIHLHGRAFLYVSRDTGVGQVVLVRRAAVRFAQLAPFLEALGLAGIAALLLAGALAFVLARRITRPIASLAAATTRLAAGDRQVVVDVSGDDELADLGRAFNGMSAELARVREEQRTFLESVSHDLKTPLTSVRGYAEALADEAIGPEEAGRVIAAEAERIQRLVADLLDLARLGRADFSITAAPVDVAALADEAVARHLIRARELGISLTAIREAPARVTADPERLLQACSNLIENALRLTPAGGEVTVVASGCRLRVQDTGPGLDDDDLPRAFERFYLHDRYKADPGRAVGSGLGLAIVHRLVTAMEGEVRAENRASGGAAFTITLRPAEDAGSPSPATPSAPSPG